jgi:hypothetical protein
MLVGGRCRLIVVYDWDVGFREAEQKVYSGILAQVKSLRAKYPSYQVICTGHR